MLRQRVAVISFLALVLPSSLAAQSQVQIAISGFGGVAIPAADLVDVFIPDVGAINFGHKTGWNAGGRLAVWPSTRIGIEAEAAYVAADVEVVGILPDFAEEETIGASFFAGSLSLLYAVIAPPLDPVAVYVSGGVGLVSRGGDFFDGSENRSDVAGVIGVGLRYGLGPGWRIRFDVKDYISSYLNEELDAALEPIGTDAQLQNDIMLTAGVEFFFNPGQ